MDINTQQRDIFQALLEALPDAIVITDSAGIILLANSQTEQLFDYHHEELINQPVELLMPERFRAIHGRHRSSYSGHPYMRSMGVGLELRGQRKDGSTFPVEISLSPLEMEGGLLVSSAIRDISTRRQAETGGDTHSLGEALEENLQPTIAEQISAEAAVLQRSGLAVVGGHAVSIAQEITNPLYAARSYLNLLADDLPTPLQDTQYLSITRDQLTRIAEIIERVRHFYPPEGAEGDTIP